MNGNMENSLRIEEHTAALATEGQGDLLRQNLNSAIMSPDNLKRVQTALQQNHMARPELT